MPRGQKWQVTGWVTYLRRDQGLELAFQVWFEETTPLPYTFREFAMLLWVLGWPSCLACWGQLSSCNGILD